MISNDSQTKYKISCVTQADYDETYQKVQAGIAGGTAPDIALMNVSAAQTLNSKGLLGDVGALVTRIPIFRRMII